MIFLKNVGNGFKPFPTTAAVWLFLFACPVLSAALEIPARPDGYVTDRAALLSPAAKSRLENLLYTHELETSNQVLVLTLPSLEGEVIEDYALRIAEAWKPGQKGRDNGILFLIAKEDRQMRIEVGYGLEGVLPDSVADAILRGVVAPRFQAGRYEEGILAGSEAILAAIRGEFQNDGAGALPGEDPFLPFIKGCLFIAGLLLLLDLGRYGRYRFLRRLYAERYAFLEWFIRFSILLLVFGTILKLIYYALLSSRGGYYGSRRGYSSFPGGSSGGFGGGGGGGFGGGGASGRW